MMSSMDLPVMPPVEPMLAKLQNEIPRGEAWLYEPKWDGFRAIVYRDGNEVHIGSRDGKALERYFPEMVPAFLHALPERCVIDGEVVVPAAAGLDFDTLLQRIHPAPSRIKLLSEQTPGSFVAFDLLSLDDRDLTQQPLERRRVALEGALPSALELEERTRAESRNKKAIRIFGEGRASHVFLTPQTAEGDEASRWFDLFEEIGLDGVIAKRRDLPYVPGRRVMVKVKKQRTADCVVGGYRLSKTGDGVGSLLLGLYDDSGTLHYVGHTSSFKAAERRDLLTMMRSLEGGTSFVGGRAPGGPSRWTGQRDISWTPVEPKLVCEVRYDRLQGDRFRHATTFLRWRTDRDPRSCTLDQVLPR